MEKTGHITDEIQIKFFSYNQTIPEQLSEIVTAFRACYESIKSPEQRLTSNGVLYSISKHLSKSKVFQCEQIVISKNGNYVAEKGKKIKLDIGLPSYSGKKKEFNPDIMSNDGSIIVEVEAGQAVDNYRFLKDLFESIIYTSCEYLVICVRNVYCTYSKEGDVISMQYDYETVCDFMKWLYTSRIQVPLKGILIIGY